MNIQGFEVPDTIVGTATGAVIGAAVGLIGIFFNDWRNTVRLKIQNAHAQKLASDAREHTLKKEILLTLPDSMNKFQGELGGLASAPTLEAIQRAFIEFSTSISKVTIVASTDTTAVATKLSAHFTRLFLDSLPKWAKVNDLHDTYQLSVKNTNDSNTRHAAANSEHAEALKAASSKPDQSAMLLAHCQRKVEIAKNESQQRRAEMDAASKAYLDALHDFNNEIITIVDNIDQHTIPMLIAIRTELGVPTDEAKLREVFREQKEAVLKSAQATLGHARKIAEGGA